jgi:hypothetical protein
MTQPNPEQFAKAVLWHLSGLRADLASVKAQLDLIQDSMGMASSAEVLQAILERERQTQLKLFEEACRDAGFSVEPPTSWSDT